MEAHVHVASNTQRFILSLAHLPEMFLKITWENCNVREETGSDTLLTLLVMDELFKVTRSRFISG